MSDLDRNPKDRFSRDAAHFCVSVKCMLSSVLLCCFAVVYFNHVRIILSAVYIVSGDFEMHHVNLFVQCRPPYTGLLYSKTGVYRGIHFCLIFVLKHRSQVLVRTEAVLT